MKEIKSKRTGKIEIINEEQYKVMVANPLINMKNFIVTDISTRSVISPIKKKNEG